jgi:hypothetical protein
MKKLFIAAVLVSLCASCSVEMKIRRFKAPKRQVCIVGDRRAVWQR